MVFAHVRPESGEPDWERLATEIQASLASDLVALGLALRKLSMRRSNRVAALVLRPTDPLSVVSPIEGPLEGARDLAERAATVDLRLAQVRRSLELMGVVVPPSWTGAPVVEPPSKTSVYGLLRGADDRGGPPALTFPLEPLPARSAPRRSKAARRRKSRSRASARAIPAKPGLAPAAPEPSPPRTIGGPVRPAITAFLLTNRTERFDIQMLNALPLPTLLAEAHGDRALLAAAGQQAEELMARVKHEVDDPASAGAFLREQVRYWHEASGQDPTWTTRMPERWAGLFADSRVHGGRLRPWLNHRLWTLHEQAVASGPLRKKWARRLRGDDTAAAQNIERAPPDLIRAEVAQAILDDLATHPHDPGTALPLIVLSELAARRQVVTVNEALGQLFSVPDAGPFVILHPNRYPDCEEVMIRPPVPRARGAALAYTLGPGRPAARPAPLPHPAVRDPTAETPSDRAAAAPSPAVGVRDSTPAEGEPPSGLDADSIWEADSVNPSAWREVIGNTREARGRLSAPPAEFRGRRAYGALLDLLLSDAESRKAFLSVRWRTRPAGPPLLAALLAEGSLSPEVSTDHEYLEAELDELVKAGRASKAEDGRWTVRGFAISREGSHKDGFQFRAQPSA